MDLAGKILPLPLKPLDIRLASAFDAQERSHSQKRECSETARTRKNRRSHSKEACRSLIPLRTSPTANQRVAVSRLVDEFNRVITRAIKVEEMR